MKSLLYILAALFLSINLAKAQTNSISKDIDDFMLRQENNIYELSLEFQKQNLFKDAKLYLISLTNLTPPYDKLIAENKKQERLIKQYENDIHTKKAKPNKHFILLIKDKNFTALIDTGFDYTQDVLIDALKQTKTRLEDIDYIILTHGHQDHLGGILDMKTKKKIFPKAKLIIDENEYKWLLSQGNDFVKKSIEGFEVIFLKDEDIFLKGSSLRISSKKAYGHTPGHRIFFINDEMKADFNLIFMADLLHTSLQISNPDINTQYDYDKNLARKTREAFLKEFKENAYKNVVVGSHSTGIINFDKEK